MIKYCSLHKIAYINNIVQIIFFFLFVCCSGFFCYFISTLPLFASRICFLSVEVKNYFFLHLQASCALAIHQIERSHNSGSHNKFLLS